MRFKTIPIIFITLLAISGCGASKQDEISQLRKQLHETQSELSQFKKAENSSNALKRNSISWEDNYVNVQSCILNSSAKNSEELKSKLVTSARVEAIEGLKVELESGFKTENICDNYGGQEICEKFISSKVDSFSKGSLHDAKYSFFKENSVTIIL